MVWLDCLSPMELFPHEAYSRANAFGIRSLIELGRMVIPLTHSVLYPRKLQHKANPKVISERTSYLQI
jgi:hypothetical protein